MELDTLIHNAAYFNHSEAYRLGPEDPKMALVRVQNVYIRPRHLRVEVSSMTAATTISAPIGE